MNPRENVLLAPFTTFHIGGPARFFVEAKNEREVEEVIAFARTHAVPLLVLGGGSNVLVPDAGVAGVVLRIGCSDIVFETDGADVLLVAGAGASWDAAVDAAAERGLFGIENLAGIPGTVGGAAVQNIGAYGAELTKVFEYADVIDSATGARRRLTKSDAAFAYRTSIFKKQRGHIIMRVGMRLAGSARPDLSYPDLARLHAAGEALTTPAEIVRAVRGIRAGKFPRNAAEGTAGSFFKNPVVSRELANELALRFPGLPAFPQEDGRVKLSLAWLLDHALSLKGHTIGSVRLYEKQPLVIVARAGARAQEVDALAQEIAKRVHAVLGIAVEREVETFGENIFS